MPSSRRRGAGAGGLDGFRAAEQRLAAQPPGDAAGFADRGSGGLVIAQVAEALGVVEQSVGEMVGGGVLAQAGDCSGERRCSGQVAVACGEAGAGQVAFGA